MHGENQHPAIGMGANDMRRGIDPAHDRHGHIEYHDVRLHFACELYRIFAVTGLTTDVPIRPRAAQEGANAFTHDLVIVNDEYAGQILSPADFSTRLGSTTGIAVNVCAGMTARTTAPALEPGTSSRWPPSWRVRSSIPRRPTPRLPGSPSVNPVTMR